MVRLIAIVAIVCGSILLFGGWFIERKDRMRITTEKADRYSLNVTVTLFDVKENYRWLALYGCTAEMTESGTFCDGNFERESGQETRVDQAQYRFPWRSLPPGMIRLTAMAFDANQKVVAQQQITVFR